MHIPDYIPVLTSTATIERVAFGEINAEIDRLRELQSALRQELQDRVELHDDPTDPEGGCLIADHGEDECEICDYRTDQVA